MNAPAPPESLVAMATEATISQQLAQFAAGLRFEDIPATVTERAKLHVLDCIGIGLASTGFEFGQRTINADAVEHMQFGTLGHRCRNIFETQAGGELRELV